MTRPRARAAYWTADGLTIINDDTLRTQAVAPGSIDLVVTSPPYNVDIAYRSHDDRASYAEYRDFSRRWMARCLELARPDGRSAWRDRGSETLHRAPARLRAQPAPHAPGRLAANRPAGSPLTPPVIPAIIPPQPKSGFLPEAGCGGTKIPKQFGTGRRSSGNGIPGHFQGPARQLTPPAFGRAIL